MRRRRAVAGRAPRHDIGDIDLGAVEPDRGQHLVQQLTGAADERDALPILVGPWRLADEHDFGARLAGAEDELGRGRLEAATFEPQQMIAQFGERPRRGGGLPRLLLHGFGGGDEARAGAAGAAARGVGGRSGRCLSTRWLLLDGAAARRGGGLARGGHAAPRRARCRRPCRRTSAKVGRGYRARLRLATEGCSGAAARRRAASRSLIASPRPAWGIGATAMQSVSKRIEFAQKSEKPRRRLVEVLRSATDRGCFPRRKSGRRNQGPASPASRLRASSLSFASRRVMRGEGARRDDRPSVRRSRRVWRRAPSSISARERPPGRSRRGGPSQTGDDRRFNAERAGSGVEDEVDLAAKIGADMGGGDRAEPAGAIGRGRRERQADRAEEPQRRRMRRDAQGDRRAGRPARRRRPSRRQRAAGRASKAPARNAPQAAGRRPKTRPAPSPPQGSRHGAISGLKAGRPFAA